MGARCLRGRAPLPTGVVVPHHRAGAAAPLEVVADVVGGHAAQRGFDVVAVPVVGEAGADCAAHDRQAVFGDATALLYLYFCIRFLYWSRVSETRTLRSQAVLGKAKPKQYGLALVGTPLQSRNNSIQRET